MHVGVLTYQTGHLKTIEVVRKMMTKAFTISVFAFPFKLRPRDTRHYQDRPYPIIDFPMKEFCAAHGVRYVEVDGWGDEHAAALGGPGTPDAPDVFLHCIAKIVPPTFIKDRTILNCHPGLLPHNRGVDAFKWSIVNRWPIGITLHVIDEQIDRGTILHRMRIPVLPQDRLPDVWQRAYDFEVDLLANFEHHLDNRRQGWEVGDDHPCSRRRIPADIDARLEAYFLDVRDEMVALSRDPGRQPHPADAFGDGRRLAPAAQGS